MTPGILLQLGIAVRDGMRRVDEAVRLTDPARIKTSYSTRFQMPDGRWWALQLEPSTDPDA
jgi:hypothetical protein